MSRKKTFKILGLAFLGLILLNALLERILDDFVFSTIGLVLALIWLVIMLAVIFGLAIAVMCGTPYAIYRGNK